MKAWFDGVRIVQCTNANIDFVDLMADVDGQRRAAQTTELSFAKRRRLELCDVLAAPIDHEFVEWHGSEHHAWRSRNMLADPAMTPARIIGLGDKMESHRTAGTSTA